jgi:HD superfamily phosphohydrolase
MKITLNKNKYDKHSIYDVLYGFIPITEWEAKIIDSPYFQRLRWVKQLGFSNYIFPGAEHNRFAHAIGVMHSMHQMIKSLGIDVPDQDLFNPKAKYEAALLHKSLRIAALLHDLGTFPFSHAIENAYIRHGNDKHRAFKRNQKELPNSHEHLGSFIIKNTRFPGGMTQILEDYHFDVSLISKIIKGDSKYFIANQLMHSDLDADRMDYLFRDSHYTGIKYGQFDRDYILTNLKVFSLGKGQYGFGIRESAQHAVEDFLISRFNWYSQVIKNSESAKFDIMSSHLTKAFLEEDLMFQFHDILSMIQEQDERFFWWNDIYFMNRCQEIHYKKLTRDIKTMEQLKMLLYRIPPKTVNHPLFHRRILQTHSKNKERETVLKKIHAYTELLQKTFQKNGTGKEWFLVDIPKKDVAFTSPPHKKNPLQALKERDAIKMITKEGIAVPLVQMETSLMHKLSGFINFVPSLYANDHAYTLMKKKKLI